MEVGGVCDHCGKPSTKIYTCVLCGARVCPRCVSSEGLCPKCKRGGANEAGGKLV